MGALDLIGHEEVIGDWSTADYLAAGLLDDDDGDDIAGWSTLGDYLAAGDDLDDDYIAGDDLDDDFAAGADDDIADLLAITGARRFRGKRGGRRGLKKLVSRLRGRMARAKKKEAALRSIARKDAVAVVDRRYNRKREYPLGLDSGAVLIPPGGTATITVFPQVTYRAERLQVDSGIAAFFNILDIVVGKNSQKVTPEAIPASVFSEVAVGVRLLLDTSNIGNVISVSVQNVDTLADRRFRGAIIGTALDR